MNEREESESVLLYHCPTCGATHLDPVEDAENAALRQQLAEARAEVERQHMAVLKASIDNYPAAKASIKDGVCTMDDFMDQSFDDNLADVVALIGLERVNAKSQLAAQAAELERLRSSLVKAEKELNKPRCEHCGSDKLWDGPPECPRCGAPQCCETCCRLAIAMMVQPVVTVQLITTDSHRLFNAEVVSQDGGELTGMYVNLNTETLPESAKPGDRFRAERKRDEVWNAFMVWKPFGGPLKENNS